MNNHRFSFCGSSLEACPTGILWMPEERVLCVSDLHLGKSDRMARRGNALLPPYETLDTLARLASEITRYNPRCVICLGDSFDDLVAVDAMTDPDNALLASMQAGREWVWIEGNHDPGPVGIGGAHMAEITVNGLNFCHIATVRRAEISGHYHPKHSVSGSSARACFVYDADRLILPAFGTFTGGLRVSDPVLRRQFGKEAAVVLTGRRAIPVPLQ